MSILPATSGNRLGLAAAVLLLVLPVLTVWNLMAQSFAPKLAVMVGPQLRGFTVTAPPPNWSLQAFVDGSLQKALTDAITEAFPLRPLMIRINNQIRYKLFGQTGAPGVVIGVRRQLIEQGYVDEYCARNPAALEAKAREWVGKLKELQDFYTKRGRVFIYLVTPSKIAYMPENFPRQVAACKNTGRDRNATLPLYVKILKDADINVVDTASRIHGLKGKYDVDLFPAGGVHWNAIGIAVADEMILAEINRQAGGPIAPKPAWKYRATDVAKGTDRDLLDLLNVISPDARYLTAAVSYEPKRPCSEEPVAVLSAAMVGGSFAGTLGASLVSQGCLVDLEGYNYLYRGLRAGAEFKTVKWRLDASDILPLRDADIVILEENEQTFPASAHAMEFYRVILGR